MPIVRIPGRGDVRFPDNMTPYQIQLAIEREILPGRKPEAISAPERPEGGFLTGLQGIGAATAAIPAYFEKAVEEIRDELKSPVEKAREAARVRAFGPVAARSQAQMEAAKQQTNVQMAEPEFDTMLGRGLYSGTSSFIQNLPGTVASVIKQTSVPALANIAAVTAPTTYQKYRERGASVGEAALGTSLETGIELGTELIPLNRAVKILGKVGFGSFIKQYLGRELPSEAVATILQNAVDTAIANPDKTWADYVNELPSALGETAIATLVPGTVLAGASKVAQTLQREPRAATEEAPPEEPGAEAGAASRRPSPPPPPPADMGALTKALGPVGGKVTLQEPSGPQEYTYQGLDEDGSVLLADPDGNVFAEDPAQISAAMKVGAVEPENGLGAVAFGGDVTEGLPPVRAEAEAATIPVAGPREGAAPGFVRVYHGGSPLEPNETGRMFTTSREYAEGHASEFPGAEVLYTDLPENDPRITPEYPEQGPKQGFTFNPQLTAEEMKGVRSLGAGPLPTAPVSRIFQPSGRPAPEPAPPPPSDTSRIFNPRAPEPAPAPEPSPAPAPAPTPTSAPSYVADNARATVDVLRQRNPAVLDTVTDLHAQDKTAAEIAAATKLDVDTVRDVRIGLGLPSQGKPSGGKTIFIPGDAEERAAFEAWRDQYNIDRMAATAPAPAATAPATTAPAVESIAALEQMPIDEDVGPYLQEYSKFRTAKQILEIEDNARAIAAKRGASSVSRKDIFEAGMAFDDALFKEPSAAPARVRARAPAPVPAPTPTVEPAPKAKAEPYRPDKREPAVVWENFNKAFETQEYPSVNWAIGSDWGMGTSSSIDTPEGYRRAATERMERLYGPDPTATTAPEPVTEQTLRDAGFTSGEIASWRSGQGSKDYAEKAGRGFIYYKGDFTPATAENVAEITSRIEADIAKNAATRERLIATDTGKRTALVGDARPQLLAENLKDLETSDSKLKAKIEGLNRQLERAKKAAAPKPVTEDGLFQNIPDTSRRPDLVEEPRNTDIDALIGALPPRQRVNVRAQLDRITDRYEKNGDVGMLLAGLDSLRRDVYARIYRNQLNRARPRVRGFERAMEVLYRAERDGRLAPESAALARWLIQRNPRIADDLAFSFQAGNENSPAGQYNAFARLVTVFAGGADGLTAAHEILHHTERMMPEPIREGIRAAWRNRIDSLMEMANRTNNVEMRRVLGAVVQAYYGNEQAQRELAEAFRTGSIPYSVYHLSNPSEFWAVNASELLSDRASRAGWVGAARNWLRDFIESVKNFFGLPNNAAVVRGLRAVLAAESGVMTGEMLANQAVVSNVSSLPERRARQVLERARAIEANGMRNSVDEIEDVIDDLDAVYKTLPEDTEIRQAVDDASNKLESLLYRIEDARRPSNQNIAETEYERAYRETSVAEDAYYDFLQNEDDERRFMDRRTKARKEFEKEIDRLFDAKEAALKRLRDIIAKEQKAALKTMNTGTPEEMKAAIAAVQKPDDKVMDERANLQEQNRGCD